MFPSNNLFLWFPGWSASGIYLLPFSKYNFVFKILVNLVIWFSIIELFYCFCYLFISIVIIKSSLNVFEWFQIVSCYQFEFSFLTFQFVFKVRLIQSINLWKQCSIFRSIRISSITSCQDLSIVCKRIWLLCHNYICFLEKCYSNGVLTCCKNNKMRSIISLLYCIKNWFSSSNFIFWGIENKWLFRAKFCLELIACHFVFENHNDWSFCSFWFCEFQSFAKNCSLSIALLRLKFKEDIKLDIQLTFLPQRIKDLEIFNLFLEKLLCLMTTKGCADSYHLVCF